MMTPTNTTPARPQFSLGQMLVIMCVLGAGGGLVVRYSEVLTRAVFSSGMLFALLFYGSIVVAPVAILFVVVQLIYEDYRPVSACLFIGLGALILVGWYTGTMPEELASVFVWLMLLAVPGCWIEILVVDVWSEHWSTAAAMTMVAVTLPTLITLLCLMAGGA